MPKGKRGPRPDATDENGGGFDAGPVNRNIRSKPVQEDLPGELSDRKIRPLHAAALEYVGFRDQRMQIGAQEIAAKSKLLDLMHKYKKENYVCDGIEIEIIKETEKIKVRVAKGDDEPDLNEE